MPPGPTDPHPAVARRALSIAEIYNAVCTMLAEPDLFHCALVCRAWTTVALDVLWRDMHSAVNIFSLLREMNYRKNEKDGEAHFVVDHDMEPEPEAWLHLEKYSKRIKSFSYVEDVDHDRTGWTPSSVLISDETWDILARTRITMPLLPNLAALTWHRGFIPGSYNTQLQYFPLLLHPNLRSLTLHVPSYEDTILQVVWHNIGHRAPGLTEVTITMNLGSDDEDMYHDLHQALAVMLSKLKCLRNLTLPPFWCSAEVIRAVSPHADLTSLVQGQISPENDGDPSNVSDFRPSLGDGSFPALSNLHLASNASDCVAFLTQHHSPRFLASMSLHCANEVPTPLEVRNVLDALSTTLPLLLHLSLDFRVNDAFPLDSDSDSELKPDVFDSLRKLSNLETFCFHYQAPLGGIPELARTISEHLPHLRRLVLNPSPFLISRGYEPAITLADLGMFAEMNPHLVGLGLYFKIPNIDDADDVFTTPSREGTFRGPIKLDVGLSRAKGERAPSAPTIAASILRCCPDGCELHHGYDRPRYDYIGPLDYDTDDDELWAEVAETLKSTERII